MKLQLSDKETLSRYAKSLNAMKEDYIDEALSGIEKPTLQKVAREMAEAQWQEVYKNNPLPNPSIQREILADALDFVDIVGTSVGTAKAIANNNAIREASAIYATEEDAQKKAELEELCKALNSAFNGAGNYFNQYILLDGGTFVLNPRAINFKPLIYGE